MKKLLLLAVLSSACGQGTFTYCDVDHVGTVASKLPLDCATVQHNFMIAERVLTYKLVPKDKFQQVYGGTYFEIEEGNQFNVWGVQAVSGYDDSFTGNVSMNRSMQALVHEMLHVWDTYNGQNPFDPDPHKGWDTNGYGDIMDSYLVRWIEVPPAGATPRTESPTGSSSP
jgi:hypothetical protein